jgi:hypothetical protein
MEKTLREKRLELLEDTVKYYSSDTNRRCITKNGGCYYSPEKANMVGFSDGCAIGRLLSAKLRIELDSGKGNSAVDYCGVFDKLPEEIRLLGMGFLSDLQKLHDKSTNWGRNHGHGLLIAGKDYVSLMKENIENDSFDDN